MISLNIKFEKVTTTTKVVSYTKYLEIDKKILLDEACRNGVE